MSHWLCKTFWHSAALTTSRRSVTNSEVTSVIVFNGQFAHIGPWTKVNKGVRVDTFPPHFYMGTESPTAWRSMPVVQHAVPSVLMGVCLEPLPRFDNCTYVRKRGQRYKFSHWIILKGQKNPSFVNTRHHSLKDRSWESILRITELIFV